LSVHLPSARQMSSYHIQDLRLVLPTLDFDLRVNKHCAKVNVQFREWIQESFHGDTARVEELSEHRFDLLCSLCFPTIDPPQLLRVSKLCALTSLANDGHIRAGTPPSGYVPRVEPVLSALNHPVAHSGPISGSNLLNPEHLLEVVHSVRTRQAQELECRPSTTSGTSLLLRFTGNLLSSLYSSRDTNAQITRPGLLEFLTVLENAYDRNFSEELVTVSPLAPLWRYTTNIIVWSQVTWQMEYSLIVGELIRMTGPRFIHVQTPSGV